MKMKLRKCKGLGRITADILFREDFSFVNGENKKELMRPIAAQKFLNKEKGNGRKAASRITTEVRTIKMSVSIIVISVVLIYCFMIAERHVDCTTILYTEFNKKNIFPFDRNNRIERIVLRWHHGFENVP